VPQLQGLADIRHKAALITHLHEGREGACRDVIAELAEELLKHILLEAAE
jgi:hypothetical protein